MSKRGQPKAKKAKSEEVVGVVGGGAVGAATGGGGVGGRWGSGGRLAAGRAEVQWSSLVGTRPMLAYDAALVVDAGTGPEGRGASRLRGQALLLETEADQLLALVADGPGYALLLLPDPRADPILSQPAAQQWARADDWTGVRWGPRELTVGSREVTGLRTMCWVPT